MYYVSERSTYAIAIVFPILCTIFVTLRFLSRRRMRAGYGVDDWMAVTALISTFGCAAILIYGMSFGTISNRSQRFEGAIEDALGFHDISSDETQSLSTITLNAKLRFSFVPISVLSIGLIRLTITLLYRRIFPNRIFTIANTTIMGIIVAWTVAYILACLFQCAPHFSAYWSPTRSETYCQSSYDIYFSMALIDVLIDIIILILPIKPILSLQLPNHRKLLVLLVFALGIFSIAAGITRMALLLETPTYDPNGEVNAELIAIAGTLLWWTYMEIGVGCLVSNMPVIIGFFRGWERGPLGVLRARMSRINAWSSRAGFRGQGKSASEYESTSSKELQKPGGLGDSAEDDDDASISDHW